MGRKVVLLALAGLLLAAGCAKEVPPAEVLAQPTATAQVQRPAVIEAENRTNTVQSSDGADLLFTYVGNYPKVTSPENAAAAAINAYYTEKMDEAEKLAAQYVPDEAAYQAALQSSFGWQPYAYEDGFAVGRNDGVVLSIVEENATFVGGVHATTLRTGSTFLMEDGRPLALTDLFAEGTDGMAFVYDAVYAAILESPQAAEYLVQSRDDVTCLPENGWYIMPDGTLQVCYPPYSIAPYALQDNSMFTITIPEEQKSELAKICLK